MAFKKGESGNPSGGRKEKIVFDALNMTVKADMKSLRMACRALLQKAARGDLAAFREMADRLDGKPEASMNVTTENKSLASLTLAELADRIEAIENGAGVPADGENESQAVH